MERKKKWGCHCTTKRKMPWLTFPPASFVLDSAWVLNVLSSPSFSWALHTRPPAPLRADGRLSRPTAHPSGLSGLLLARATWLPESSPVRAAADAESRSPWDPNEGTRHLGTSGTWRGGAGRAGRLARGPAASREECRPEARQKGRVSSTVPLLRERDLAGWKSCTGSH